MRWVFSKLGIRGRRRTMVGATAAAIVAFFSLFSTPALTASPPIGDGMANYEVISPPLPLTDQVIYVDETGNERPLNDHAGKWVLVNFWATWCAPCIREMPDLDELAERYADQGMIVLTLSQDRGGRPVVDAFFDKHGYRHLPRALDPKAAAARALKARGLPTSFLIDPAGRVVGRVTGIAKWTGADGRALFDHYLKGETAN